ncbi:unnamed protein product [Dovyalis caffra]|uniref:Uncharacterized protein n=1 Tax=Dovyalis caffra TaxID=77055 RepID=A0AAV1SPY8_9ROSI|nr:unnamed protein product [Dovyalis caffra]
MQENKIRERSISRCLEEEIMERKERSIRVFNELTKPYTLSDQVQNRRSGYTKNPSQNILPLGMDPRTQLETGVDTQLKKRIFLDSK